MTAQHTVCCHSAGCWWAWYWYCVIFTFSQTHDADSMTTCLTHLTVLSGPVFQWWLLPGDLVPLHIRFVYLVFYTSLSFISTTFLIPSHLLTVTLSCIKWLRCLRFERWTPWDIHSALCLLMELSSLHNCHTKIKSKYILHDCLFFTLMQLLLLLMLHSPFCFPFTIPTDWLPASVVEQVTREVNS
jgi:hypothetical protein